jgi:hypothetical protein
MSLAPMRVTDTGVSRKGVSQPLSEGKVFKRPVTVTRSAAAAALAGPELALAAVD